jgi:hypothetical protein
MRRSDDVVRGMTRGVAEEKMKRLFPEDLGEERALVATLSLQSDDWGEIERRCGRELSDREARIAQAAWDERVQGADDYSDPVVTQALADRGVRIIDPNGPRFECFRCGATWLPRGGGQADDADDDAEAEWVCVNGCNAPGRDGEAVGVGE